MKRALNSIRIPLLRGLGGILFLAIISFAVLGSFFLLPANIHYHVTERYVFSGMGEDTPFYLGIMLPKSGPYQMVENIEVLWGGVQQVDRYGFVDILKLSGNKNIQGSSEAIIEYDVMLPQKPVSWTAPVENFQRLPQLGIESDCKCMQEIAASIRDGGYGKSAYKIYSFVIDYLTYSQEKEIVDCTSVSAIKALEIGECACSGYARLMTALCRASDIPSQMVLGLVYLDPMFRSSTTSFPYNPNEAHAWVEYYSEGSWKMADPTWGGMYLKFMQFNRNDGRHLVYGELDELLSVDVAMEIWALRQATFILSDDASFRYFATSDSNEISFTPMVSIERKWDGRWVNTLIVWGIMIWLLCKYRDKFISLPEKKIKQR